MLLPEEVPQDVGDLWSPVAPDDEVWAPPSANEMQPPTRTSPQLLPTRELSWENFEKLVYCVAKEIDGGMDFRMHGKRGQARSRLRTNRTSGPNVPIWLVMGPATVGSVPRCTPR